MANPFKSIEREIKKGINRLGDQVKSGINKLGNEVESGVKKVGHEVESGVKNAGNTQSNMKWKALVKMQSMRLRHLAKSRLTNWNPNSKRLRIKLRT